MATNFTSTTLPGLYNDDWDSASGYHQVLFNSGRALQARELTTLQTMIYKEMGRMGSNIFKEGSTVTSGGMSVNAEYDYVQIDTSNGVFSDLPVGTIFTQAQTGVQAKVLQVEPTAGVFTCDTIYVQYINSGQAVVGSSPKTFSAGDTLNGGGYELTVRANPEAPALAVVGKGVRFDVAGGDYFVVGRFVHTTQQSIILSPYSQIANTRVGFAVNEEVVTVNDTPQLYDISAGAANPNTASPGADRYRITLTLTEQSAIDSLTQTFVFIAAVENSTIVEEVAATDGYNTVNDLMALRTNEESGDYVINPFVLDFDSADADNLSVSVSPGLAYVNGYRVENPSSIELLSPRSNAVETVDNDVVSVIYGNYTLVTATKYLPDLTYSEIKISTSTTDPSTAIIGTARVRAVEQSGAKWKWYLFDINLNAGADFGEARTIGTSSASFATLDIGTQGAGITPKAQLFQTTDNDLFMPTSRARVQSLTDINMTVARSSSLQATAGEIQMPGLSGAGAYTDTGLWIAINENGLTTAFAPTVSAGFLISGLNATDTYTIIHYVNLTSTATIATKTITSSTATITGVAGVYTLGVPDVIDVSVIKKDTTGGIDVSERFVLDDGQRDNFYDDAQLTLIDESTDPAVIYVEYTHYTRGAGDFYAPESYVNTPYADIPEHTLQDGTVISLRNYLDFRPDKNAGTYSNIKRLPRNGSSITADISYYLPRADKLIVTQEGDIQLLMGQQSRDPQLKQTPDNALELYQILMNANTANGDDVQIRAIEHKRYTMADIAALDNKIEALKEYTELNIAELRAYHTPALDSDGLERPTVGIVVDNGDDQSGAATDDDDYAASIDPENNLIRPMIDEDNVRLIRDTDLSQGVVKKGDNIYLSYDSAEWQFQNLASRTIKVNPFGLVDNVGVIKLSPSSDEWKDAKADAIKAIQGSAKLDTKQAFLWNNSQWNWKGRADEDLWQSDVPGNCGRPESGLRQRQFRDTGEFYSSSRGTGATNGYVRRVVQRDTLRRTVGNRVIDLALIPWIRSRKIYFHAKGLKPNTKFTPFFDGKNVAAWCREETSFVKFSDRTDDNGNANTYNSLANHPKGSTDLIADASGEIIGSFWIPNLRPTYYASKKNRARRIRSNYLRFRAGIREFKLLDISENNWAKADSKAFAYYTVAGALWHKWNGILSTRGQQYNWPLGRGSGTFPSAYSPAELKKVLDATSATYSAISNTGLNIVQAQLAGKYGPNTDYLNQTALNTLSADGQMSQVLSDYINVNNKQFAGTSVGPITLPQNPLAQTFYVDNQYGLVLTKINLFFKSKDSGNLPVSIHIRPVIDGKPATNDIVPDSHVYLKPNEVTALGGSLTLTDIRSSATEFVFDEPVFLQPWTQYCVVITSSSTEYEVYSAKTTESVLGGAGTTVTTQPSAGSLFLPQNGVFWFEAKDQDLMMKITRAKFNTGGGSLVLKNAPLSAKALDDNPIRLTLNSPTVYVKAPCHGLAVGDTTQLDSCEAISNIGAVLLNGVNHTITAADINGYQFDIGTNADADISGGGEKVLTQRNAVFDIANPNIESIIPNFTSLDFQAKFLSGIHISGDAADRFKPNGEAGTMVAAKYQKITADQNIEFDTPRAIYNSDVTDGGSGLGNGNPGETASCYVKVDFKTSNDYVSPVVDMQRASLNLTGQCIDDGDTSAQIYGVAETEASGGTAASKHITTPVTLEVPATGFEINSQVSLPNGSDVDVYFRTAASDQLITDQNWVYRAPVNAIANTATGQFTSASYLPGGPGGTLPPFNQVQTKFVFKGVTESPTLRGLNIKFLAE